MSITFHILAGALALGTGYLALAAAKGGPWHRRTGRWFVYTMLAMGLSGAAIAAVQGLAPLENVPAGLLTAYLVATGLTTVRPTSATTTRVNRAAILVAVGGGALSIALGLAAFAAGRPSRGVMPVIFGAIALAAGLSDRRVLRDGPLHGPARLRRHLWRMCTALLIASMAFFFGQADEFPAALRIPALLAMPVLAVLAAMVFWLWRVRRGQPSPTATRPPRGSWFARHRLDLDADDFESEVRAHLAIAQSDRMAEGVDPEAARLAALKDFGNVTLTTDAARRVWTPRWLDALRDLTADVRYAVRSLARHPGFALTVIGVLTLGIGLNAAVFTMLEGIALTPLAGVDRSSSLAVVFAETSAGRALRVSYPDYVSLRDHGRAFSGLFGSALAQVNLGRGRGAAGALLGLIVAVGASRLLAGVLVGVSATDATSFGGALAIVFAGVALATLLPASRAARTDPLQALRHD